MARVHLSKHYPTMYRSLHIEGNGIQPTYLDQIRKLTETTDLSLSIHRRNLQILTEWNLQILTVCALRMRDKILFVIVLPISGSCQSMVYGSVIILILNKKTVANRYPIVANCYVTNRYCGESLVIPLNLPRLHKYYVL